MPFVSLDNTFNISNTFENKSNVPAVMTMGFLRLVLSDMMPNNIELQAAENNIGNSMMATHVAAVQQ